MSNRRPLTWENGVADTTVRPDQEGTCSMQVSHSPDAIAVADAGLILAATLAEGLLLRELFDTHVDLGDAPGAANIGDKAMTLVHSALAGGEWIDDVDRLRAGATGAVLGHRVAAPSTLGTFLRSFTWGSARQLDQVAAQALCRTWQAGASGPITLRADSGFYTHKVIDACRKQDVTCSITVKVTKAVRQVIRQIPEQAWTPIPYWLDDGADIAETSYRPFGRKGRVMRLIVRRVRPTPGSRLALCCDYDYHPFVTDRQGSTLELEADHRRHAEVENTIRDLKYGVGLNHLPSGKFAANAAWLTLNVIAHNLARWVSRIGLGERLVTTKTLRVRYLDLPGRLTRSAR